LCYQELASELLACVEQLDPVAAGLESTAVEADSATKSTRTPCRITHLAEASIMACMGVRSSRLVYV
jgi:hypothetical protein